MIIGSFFSHSFFYKSILNSRYLVAIGFVLVFIYFLQTITGILIASGLSKGKSLILVLHSCLPSVFVFFSYLHLYKSVYFRWGLGDFRLPAYFSGWLCLIILFATCFSGYLIPWGQLSFWGTKVVTSFLDYIPVFGFRIKLFIWGSLIMDSNIVGKRFYVLHIILGVMFSFFLCLHLYLVHKKKSIILPQSSISEVYNSTYLYPTYYIKDFFMFCFNVLILGFLFIFFFEFFEETGNVEPGCVFYTPLHIVPEWYFLPSFSVLKYITNASLGIILAVLIIFFINLNLLISYYFSFINYLVSSYIFFTLFLNPYTIK